MFRQFRKRKASSLKGRDQFEQLREQSFKTIRQEQMALDQMAEEYQKKGWITKKNAPKASVFPTLWYGRVYYEDGKIVTSSSELSNFNPEKQCYSCRKFVDFPNKSCFTCHYCDFRNCFTCWADEYDCLNDSHERTCKRCLLMILTFGRWIHRIKDQIKPYYRYSLEFMTALALQDPERLLSIGESRRRDSDQKRQKPPIEWVHPQFQVSSQVNSYQ